MKKVKKVKQSVKPKQEPKVVKKKSSELFDDNSSEDEYVQHVKEKTVEPQVKQISEKEEESP